MFKVGAMTTVSPIVDWNCRVLDNNADNNGTIKSQHTRVFWRLCIGLHRGLGIAFLRKVWRRIGHGERVKSRVGGKCGVEETTVLWLTDNDDAARFGGDVLILRSRMSRM
jgi:hypothetical protein